MADNVEIIVLNKADLEGMLSTIQQGFDALQAQLRDLNKRLDLNGVPRVGPTTVTLPPGLARDALKAAVTRPPARRVRVPRQ